MQCLGTTRGWCFYEHAGHVVAVDEKSLDVTEVLSGELAESLIADASAPDGTWYPPGTRGPSVTMEELAEEAFTDGLEPTAAFLASGSPNARRSYVPPPEVSYEAREALDRRIFQGRGGNSRMVAVARMLASGAPVPLEEIRRISRYWSGRNGAVSDADAVVRGLLGGDAGKEWSTTVSRRTAATALLAAAYNPDEGVDLSPLTKEEEEFADPNTVHRYVPSLLIPVCRFCGMPESADIHNESAVDYGVEDINPEEPHFFTMDPNDEDSCEVCGGPVDDDLHTEAARAQYYEFRPAIDAILAKDADVRKRLEESQPPLIAGAGAANDDDLVWRRWGNEDEDPLTYFVSSTPEDSMMVDAVYVFDGDSFYRLDPQHRVWKPEQLPQGEHIYPVDDATAAVTIKSVLYIPMPFDMRECDREESALMETCTPHLDHEMLNRSLISSGPLQPSGVVPDPVSPAPIGPDEYTPEERSRNASKQGRDSSGRFAPSGGGLEPSASQEAVLPHNGKARLKVPVKLLSQEELTAVFDTFAEYVRNRRAASTIAPPEKAQPTSVLNPGIPVTAAAPEPVTEEAPAADVAPDDISEAPAADDSESGSEPGFTSPEESDVAPINMAIMDPTDETAVMDLIQLVPASATSVTPKAFKRVAGGRWEEDIRTLRSLQGPTPPPVKVLDDATYQDVLGQIDSFYTSDVVASVPPSNLALLYASDGVIIAGGVPGIADTPGDIAAVEKLKRYWTIGRGGAKIRWNTPGDWTRCYRHLRKYMGPRAKGYCANLHKAMTAVWPGDRRNVGHRRHRNRNRFAVLGDNYDVATSQQIISLTAAIAQECDCAPPSSPVDTGEGAPFIIKVLAPVGIESGDGRRIKEGALSHRELPIPLLWQFKTKDGHDESVIVGRIDSMEQLDDGSLGNARGVFDIGTYGQEAERLVRHKFLRGVSADFDKFLAKNSGKKDKQDKGKDGDAAVTISPDDISVEEARVMAATLVAKPAFQECSIELDEPFQEDAMIADGTYIGSPETDEELELMVEAALVASGIPVTPPKEWFDNPGLTEETPLTVDPSGRVFGHIATWNTDHIGLPFSTRPPKSRSNYAYFHTGVLSTAEGDELSVGQLTLVGGHADMMASAQEAIRHYDDTDSAFADVRAGEDRHGIWVAGALRPGVTPEKIRAIRAAAPSGDWRPINGRLELVAVCQVNTPGFPTVRAQVASGQLLALVAAGTATLNRIRASREAAKSSVEDLTARVASLEAERDRLLSVSRDEAVARVASARAAITDSHRAEMASIRERISAPIPESMSSNYSPEQLAEFSAKGLAMSDGSYPITTVYDLRNALRAYNRAPESDQVRVRRHIRKCATTLGQVEMLPESWSTASAISQEFQTLADESTEEALFRDYSQEKRDEYESKGWAMRGGRYPIANAADLKRAIRAYGRGAPSDKPSIRRHIRKRARALGKTDLIPESWSQAAMEDSDLSAEVEDAAAILAAGGRYPNGEPWNPKEHPRDAVGRFREVLARIREVAAEAGDDALGGAVVDAQNAVRRGNLKEARSAAKAVLDRIDAHDSGLEGPATVESLRAGYRDLGAAVANLPLEFGDLNKKFRFSDLPPDLQSLMDELLTRVEHHLDGEDARRATREIKSFMAGGDVLSQPEISGELARLLRYLI